MNERPNRHPAADLGPPPDWSAIRRVLVVRADNLGDVVLATPALRALHRAAPHAVIDLLASPVGATVAPMIPVVRDVLTVSASWQRAGETAGVMHALAAEEWRLVERIRARAYDALLVLTSASQSPWPVAHVGLLAGIPLRAVHSTEFGGAVATHWVTPPPEGTHQVDRCLHLLAALGVPATGTELELDIPGAAAPSGPYAVLAPGGSCPSRRYPPDRFAAAARILAGTGLPVHVAGSPNEKPLVDEVVTGAAHPLVTPLGEVTVPELATVITAADVVVCNNSGCLHLADAARVPVVVTYAGTELPTEMPPRTTPAAELLGRPVPCSPCRQFRCPYHQECLDLPAADVAAAALRLTTQAAV